MKLLTGFTNNPKQTLVILLADDTAVSLSLEYRPNQAGWFYDWTYQGRTVNGNRLVSSPNILRAFRDLIPFGLAVLASGNVEPLNQQDLVDGTVKIYLLDSADLARVEEVVYPGR